MSNLSKMKREEMLKFLDELRRQHNDDDSIMAINEIENALTEKKYGLVWEEHEERVDKELETKIPVFTEVEGKEIIMDKEKPYNFLIEGDNLHSLYLLEKTHSGMIDVIYIDPPYNLGKDFVYDDNYIDKDDSYRHSKWLSFINRRLLLAKKLLSKNGMIFISIDDNEGANLKLLCDEIFGEKNFVNNISVKMSEPTGVKMQHVNKRLPKLKESILFYKNEFTNIEDVRIPKEEWDSEYKLLVEGVSKKELDIVKEVMSKENVTLDEIKLADEICSRMRFTNVNKLYSDGMTQKEKDEINYRNAYRILRDVATSGGAKIIADEKKKNVNGGAFLILTPREKVYLIRQDYNEKASQPRMKLLFADQYLTSNVGDFWSDIKTTGLAAEGGINFLNGKKPMKLIERLLAINGNKCAIVLDFFAGSGSTAHAVLDLNKEDNGNRKFIICTNNENNICEEITYQRMLNVKEDYSYNLKYYKTDYIDRYGYEDLYISDELMDHIKEMVQLENHIKIDNEKYIIFYNEAGMLQLIEDKDRLNKCKKIYKPSYIFFNTEQLKEISNRGIEVITIPEYYFANELKEVGEI